MNAGTPVLCYHGLYRHESEVSGVTDRQQRYFISADQFRSHLDCLGRLGFRGASIAEIMSNPRPDLVALTFDDGRSSDYEMVRPMLLERGFGASFFIVGNSLNKPGHLSEGQLCEIAAAGFSVGSHSMTHAVLTGLSDGDLDWELRKSRELLERLLSAPVEHFAAPGGFLNRRVVERSLAAGYRVICTAVPELFEPGPIAGRFSVTRLTTLETLAALARRDPVHIARIRTVYQARQGLKRLVGVDAYEKLVRALTGRRLKTGPVH
jgi:peptidoglycan/xylan/chitin deacetylase (PgdA/CDA1 family)